MQLLTEVEISKRLKRIGIQISAEGLRKWRARNKGPAYFRSAGRVLYSADDLDSWIQSTRIEPAKRKHTRRKAAK